MADILRCIALIGEECGTSFPAEVALCKVSETWANGRKDLESY
jgi:hypothetical protein